MFCAPEAAVDKQPGTANDYEWMILRNGRGTRENLTFRAGVWLLVGANRGAGEGFRQDASGQLEAGKEGFYLVDRLQLFDKFLILIK